MKRWNLMISMLIICLLLCACARGAVSEESPIPTEATLSPEEAAAEYHALMVSVLEDPAQNASDAYGQEYVITRNNAVAYISYSGYAAEEEHPDPAYSKQYIPEEMAAQSPEEVAYIIRCTHDADIDGSYGLAGMQSGGVNAYQRYLQITVEERISGEIVAEVKFLGGNPPEHLQAGQSTFGPYPDENAVVSWVRNAITNAVKESRAEALEWILDHTGQESYSYIRCVEFLTEFRYATLPDAQYAADNCGVDWMVQAEKCAYENRKKCRTREEMIQMLESYGFTQEQAVHGADSRGLE